MLNRLLVIVILLTLFHGSAIAVNWTNYTNSDAVRQIIVVGDNVWSATSGGAIAYNYFDDTTIKLTNTDGLGGIDLRCVEIDTSGNIWFGAGDGWLSRLSPSLNVRNFAIRDSVGLIGRAVTIYDLENEGDRLWVASDLGISKFLIYSNGGEIRDTARRLGNIPDLEDAVCTRVIGTFLWVGTSRGIAFIDKDNANIQYFGNWRSYTLGQNGLTTADIRSISSFHDTVLAGTSNGIFKFTTSPDTLWQLFGLSGSAVYDLFMIDTLMLAATSTGLYRYTTSGWTSFPSGGLTGNRANDLGIDSTGVLWAATPASGLGEFQGGSWTLHSFPGPASNIVIKMAVDSSGAIWMTHNSKGVSRLSNGQWRRWLRTGGSDYQTFGPVPNILDNDEVDITVAPDGYVWISSFGGGLYRYNHLDDSWFRWNAANCPMYGVPENRFFWAATGVRADIGGNIWVTGFASSVPGFAADSTLLVGVFAPYTADSTWQLYMAGEIGLTTNFAQNFLFDGNTAWIGRGDGLDRLDHAGTPFDPADDNWSANITNLNIFDMELDNSGNLWMATASGLFYMPPYDDTVTSFELPPEISGSVNALEADGAGNIWVGSVAGLGVLRPDSDGPGSSTWNTIYTTGNSPLLNNKINGIAININTGAIYIGTDGGLSVFESGILPPTPDLADMSAFPNPVILDSGVEEIEFNRVPSSGTLTIYTASGDLIAQINLSSTNTWNLRNAGGNRIAGGIYFFHVRSGEASGTGKFAVIR
jgi:ligand-binding sensor domain-containing protein